MNTKKIILSTFIMGFILFFWGGLCQQFIWGVPTAQVVFSSETVPEHFGNTKMLKLNPNELTTEKFDEQFKGKISTFTTDETFNWIVSTDVANWQPLNYVIREVVIQLFAGLFLSVLLAMTVLWPNKKRMVLIAVAALAGIFATFVQQMNWWHIPALFQVGLMINMLVGWLLATAVSMRFVIKSEVGT
jgi:hypothetical protein